MSLSCGPLTLEDDGRVYLDAADEDERPECLGHIEDGPDDPDLERPWLYLLDLYRDGRRGTAGYVAAVDAAWFGRFT